MALEIIFTSFIILGVGVTVSLIVFLFFIEIALIPQLYKKMFPFWFAAGIASVLHLFAHLGGEILYESRLLYISFNSLAASTLILALSLMTKHIFRAVILVEAGKRLEEEVDIKTGEIKRTRDYLQAIMDNSPDLIFTVKKDGTLSYANKKLKDILGYEPEDIRSKHFMELIPQEMHSFMQGKWEEIQKGISGTYETKVTTKEGLIVPCLVSQFVLGGYEEFLIFLNDITEKKKAENELKRKFEELELFHRIARDREVKMIELKSEIARLEKSVKELEKERTAGQSR